MRLRTGVLLAAMVLLAGAAQAQADSKVPRITTLYPAGGRAGTSFELLVGGRPLQATMDVCVSGGGVQATIGGPYPAFRGLGAGQRLLLRQRLAELAARRMTDLDMPADSLPILAPPAAPAPAAAPVKLPDSPFLRNLDTMSLRQLVNVADRFLPAGKGQRRQLGERQGELLLLQVTIDPGAAPGDRWLRLATPAGLSNALRFQIGVLPEAREQEPNDPGAYPDLPPEPPLALPVVLNGRITPGDVDRVSFRAAKGQRLVFETCARGLLPFQADTAPAPFQLALTLHNPLGRQTAFGAECRNGPDPAFYYTVPADGVYQVEVRNALDDGRRGFVYRIAIGELPFITSAFPLGGRERSGSMAAVEGWNLPGPQLPLDTAPGGAVRQATLTVNGVPSNPVTYAVDALPECTESEPNDDDARAQQVGVPVVVNGRIDRAGDVDVFRFDGRAGTEVVAEVDARRLGSPLDSLVQVLDSTGHVLGSNDNYMVGDADSRLTARLPADGAYCVQVSDSQGRGGPAYAYRLRISAPRPDFRLLVSPSALSVPAGGWVPMTVHVLREDGFAGAVAVALKDAPDGFGLSGATVPAGLDSVQMTLAAPAQPPARPVLLMVEGTAIIEGKALTRPAGAADDDAQALLWRHPVQRQGLTVAVRRSRRQAGRLELAQPGPVRVPAGGSAQVRITVPLRPAVSGVVLEPIDPPPGVTVGEVRAAPDGITFLLKADGREAKPGLADNLVLDAYVEGAFGGRDQRANGPQRQPLGILPAIPFVVVSP